MQFVVVLQKRSTEPPQRVSLSAHKTGVQTDEVVAGDMSVRKSWSLAITKAGAARQDYMIVALPPFGADKAKIVKS